MLLRLFALIALVLSAVLCLIAGAFESYVWLWMLPLTALGLLVLFLAGAFGFLMILCGRVDQEKEQEYDAPLYRKVTELIIESVLPVLRICTTVKGMGKIPAEGRFLLVCNHVNNSDPIILLNAFAGHQLAFISKQENKDMFVIGKMMHKLQCQLLNRENDREALKTILKCIQILKEDRASVAVFPEGGIHEDKKFHHFRPGVFKIAQKTQVPIVVCTLKNTRDVIRNMARYKRSDVELNVLTVIRPEEYKDLTTPELADRVYRIMAEDLGPENVAEE